MSFFDTIDFAHIVRIKIGKKVGFPASLSIPSKEVLTPSISLPLEKSFPCIDPKIAKRFLSGEMLIFGEFWIRPEGRSWHSDIFSGYSWPKDLIGKKAFSVPSGVDIKIPWEISRLQHWPQLAWFCLQKPNELNVDEVGNVFSSQIEDFWKNNPTGESVNWLCPMDVAIRAISLLMAWDLLRAAGIQFSHDWEKRFCRSLYEHQGFVYRNLEWVREGRSNHYLVNLSGLLFMEGYLPRSKSLLPFLKREFFREVRRQFFVEGSNFEGSTAYHRLSAETVAWGILSLEKLGHAIPEELIHRIYGMFEFLRTATLPSGNILQIGDNDSGRFLKVNPHYDSRGEIEMVLSSKEPLDLLSCILFPEGNGPSAMLGLVKGFLGKSTTISEIALKNRIDIIGNTRISPKFFSKRFLQSEYASMRRYSFPLDSSDSLVAFSFPEFGLYGWKGQKEQITVRCGNNVGELKGAHSHFDQLSLDLELTNEKISDPGSYVYTSDKKLRNFFRGAAAHFMPKLSDMGYGEPSEGEDMFRFANLPNGEAMEFTEKTFVGTYEFAGCRFLRKLTLESNQLIVEDFCSHGFQLAESKPVLPFLPSGYRQQKDRK